VKSIVVMRNVLLRTFRDVRTLALILLMPLFFVLLYGNSFSGSYRGLDVVIVNQDNGLASVTTAEVGRITLAVNLADAFVAGLDADTFNVILSEDPEAAKGQVGRDGIRAAIVFPNYFSNAVVSETLRRSGGRIIESEGQTVSLLQPSGASEGPTATLVLDDSDPMATDAIFRGLSSVLTDVLATQQASLEPENLLDIEPLYGGEVRVLDYTAPGIIGFALTLITLLLTAMAVVRERTGGTLTRILIAPVRPWEATVGYTLAFTAIALLQASELFLASILIFDIRFIGSPGLVALVIVLFTISLQGIATLISTIAHNEAQAMQFALFLIIPSILVSGVFWPLETMPPTIRPLAYASPLMYANAGLRKVMLAGKGLPEVGFEIAVLGGIAVLMLLLSVFSMRRQAYTA
jgi:ABC-2 type transport system permease protein